MINIKNIKNIKDVIDYISSIKDIEKSIPNPICGCKYFRGDADLIMNDCIIDFKVSKYEKNDIKTFSQLYIQLVSRRRQTRLSSNNWFLLYFIHLILYKINPFLIYFYNFHSFLKKYEGKYEGTKVSTRV
jgi:hypothetical protein